MRLSYSGLVCLPSKEDTVSSNLISRSTVNAFTKSFLLQLILDTHIGYLGSFFAIFGNFCRTRVIPVRGTRGLMATSASSMSPTTIPTGVLSRRARSTSTATMLILSFRLATSTAVSASVPTGTLTLLFKHIS